MSKIKCDLLAKLLVLPYTEMDFIGKDIFEEKVKENKSGFLSDNNFLRNVCNLLKPGYIVSSIDEISLLLKAFYPEETLYGYYNKEKDLNGAYFNTILKISKAFITKRDGYIAFKYWESGNEADFLGAYKGIHKVELWNSLTRIISPDILMVSYLISRGLEDEKNLKDINAHVVMADIPLKKILQKGVAEIHMHAQAGIDYCSKWADITNIENFSVLEDNRYYFLSDEKFKIPAKASAMLRFFMALYLEFGIDKSFSEFIRNLEICLGEKYEGVNQILKYLVAGSGSSNNIPNCLSNNITLENIIKNLCRFFELPYISINLDFLDKTVFHKYNFYNTSAENILLFKALKKMRHDISDKTFARLFWNYIRIKNTIFSQFVQNNSIQGLAHFQSYYNNATDISYNYFSGSRARHFYNIIRSQFLYGFVKKLELRVSPSSIGNAIDDGYHIRLLMSYIIIAYYKFLSEDFPLDKSYYSDGIPKVGVIYHFIKRSDSSTGKCVINQKTYMPERLYYLDYRYRYKKSAEIIHNLRQSVPNLSKFIIGVDSASIENDMEPWVLAPVFRLFRNGETDKLFEKYSFRRIKTIGFTNHVGEEFRHLMSGLRHIYEVIEYYKFRAGDRVGHAVALGTDVDTWMNGNHAVPITRIEYLENLLWLWGLNKNEIYPREFELPQLEKKIIEAANRIFYDSENFESVGLTPSVLFNAYRAKFEDIKPYCEDSCPFLPKKDKVFVWNSDKVLYAYFCEKYLTKMCEVEIVECNESERLVLKELQNMLLKRIENEGIVIETNPTSNIAISIIPGMSDHTIFNLNNTFMQNPNRNAIATINSDDPVVFNTTVTNEIAYVYYSLLEKGYSRESVLQWVDKIREYGMNSSFIETNEKHEDLSAVLGDLEVIYLNLTGNQIERDLKCYF